MSRAALACLAVSFGASAAPSPKASIPEVVAELRRIEGAALRGGSNVDVLRVQYQDLAKQNPGEAMPRVYLAWCSMPSDESWNSLKGMAPVFPENPYIRLGMARVYVSWKMKDKIPGEFAAALKIDPKFYPAIIGQADVARDAEDWAGAEKLYRAALAIADDGAAHAGLGLTLKAQGKLDDAKAELQKGVTLWPDQPVALHALIDLTRESKDAALVDAASRLAELEPRSRETRAMVAELRFARGEKAEAIKEYEKLLRMGNPDIAAVKRLVELYRDAKDADAEERTLVLQAGLDKTKGDANLRLAELKQAKKDLPGAEAQLAEVIAREPGSAEAHYRLGLIKAEKGILFEAMSEFELAQSLEGPAAATAKTEVEKIVAQLKLPKKVLSGPLENVYSKAIGSLDSFFQERRKAKPDIGGLLRLKVHIDAEGAVKGVEVIEDKVGDPLVTAHLYALLTQAQYAKKKRDTELEFDLGKKKGK